MTKQIAILRGINVGGKRKILMNDLRELFNKMGLTEVRTYIQSGNVIFNSEGKVNNAKLANSMERSILGKYDFEVPVIVRTVDELNEAISNNPFYEKSDVDLERLHLTFLKVIPEDKALANIETYDHSPDRFKIKDNNVFVYCAGKYSDSKLTNKFFENKLKGSATTRNWKTVLKLSELSKVE